MEGNSGVEISTLWSRDIVECAQLEIWNRCRCALHGSTLDEMVVAPFLSEKLREMMLAVENALQGGIVGRRDGTASMGAFETELMI